MSVRENIIQEMMGKMVQVIVDRPIGYRHGDIVYPINYGYIPGIIAGDGEPQDAYILGITEPLSAFDGVVIGAVRRKNDVEDKLVVAPAGVVFHQGQIAEAVQFQEQFFDTSIESLFRKSCGVLPYRNNNGVKEYLLVYEQFSQCWSLPKGHMEAGETESQTALRELMEETGLTAQLYTDKTATFEYPISPICRKQVVFFLGQVEGTPVLQHGEIESCKWVKAEDLTKYLYADMVKACSHLL